MDMTATLEMINQFFTSKYPVIIFIVAGLYFGGMTSNRLNSLDRRVEHLETVDIPDIRHSIEEMRVDISSLDKRLTIVEVKVNYNSNLGSQNFFSKSTILSFTTLTPSFFNLSSIADGGTK